MHRLPPHGPHPHLPPSGGDEPCRECHSHAVASDRGQTYPFLLKRTPSTKVGAAIELAAVQTLFAGNEAFKMSAILPVLGFLDIEAACFGWKGTYTEGHVDTELPAMRTQDR